MRIVIVMFAFLVSVTVFAQDVHFSKKELIEMSAESATEGACTNEFVTCVGITKAVCKEEVQKLVKGACAEQIPADGAGMDAIGGVVSDIVKCVVPGLMSKYEKNVQKNASTPACQSFMK